jgi:hypothetical protein
MSAYPVRLRLPDTGERIFATVSAPDRRVAAEKVAARWPLMPPGCLWVEDATGQSAPETVAGLLGCPDGAPAPETASTGLLAPPVGSSEAETEAEVERPGVVVRLRERELTPGQRKARDRQAQLARSERLRAHYLAKAGIGTK